MLHTARTKGLCSRTSQLGQMGEVGPIISDCNLHRCQLHASAFHTRQESTEHSSNVTKFKHFKVKVKLGVLINFH